MGQKVNPISFRLGQDAMQWDSRWIASNAKYKDYLMQDLKIRKFLMGRLKSAGINRVQIERSINKLAVIVNVSKPGIVIGRGGSGLEEIKKQLAKITLEKFDFRVEEVRQPDLSAHLVAQSVVDQLERRMPAKRVINRTAERVMSSGAKGVKILLGGRIGGAEIARHEKVVQGTLPLQTLRADIDFAKLDAHTISGTIGVKVWIHRGIGEKNKKEELGV